MRIRAAARWTWVAEREDEVVGRAVWWAPPGGACPLELDLLTVAPVTDRASVGAALIAPGVAAAGEAAACNLVLPPGWRDDPEVARAVAWRLEAFARAGLGRVVERLRFEWTADAAVPAEPPRLRLVDDLDAMRGMFARITGDADAFEGYERAAIARDGWRIAYDGDEPVGVTMPSVVDGVAFVGVVPEQRGRGNAHELLAHATRHLAARGTAV
jgi:GNAT superfamily N-acetyltransferase